MKKLILVLAIALCASQAFGVLDVYLERQGTSNVVDVKYSGAGTTTATRPRAFALELTITGGTFDSFVSGSYLVGESNQPNHKGYGIYPATIDINTTTGLVDGYGTPQAVNGDPGAGVGFTTDTIVLEFGSLYVGEVNAPAEGDTLCSLNFTPGTATEIAMADEDTYRGGLVFEDGSQGEVNDILVLQTPPGAPTNVSPTNANPKVTTTTDLVWTAGSGAESHKVYFGTTNPPAYAGTVAMPTVTFDTGTMVANTTYYWNVVATNGAGDSAASATWSFKTECYGNQANYAEWVDAGKPNCWCYPRQCHGDADGLKAGNTITGYYYVSQTDLNVLISAWQVKNSPKGPGLTGVQGCADFDHVKAGNTITGYYRVSQTDLNILISYWQVKESPKGTGTPANCVPGNMVP
ncbi:MAG: hypothetical protein WC496_05740 [Phycisphaerae bacterium]|jgi:hypothetical protein